MKSHWGWAAAVLVVAGATFAEAQDASQIADAERAFAAEAGKSGWIGAFKLYSAPDAIVFRPDPINAKESLNATPTDADSKELKWWPLWAGIAKSGDIGFTTGPYTAGPDASGNYFTVWKKQADGTWKWIFDGGPPGSVRSPLGPETPMSYLATASAGAGSAEAAKAEVAKAEAELSKTAKTDAKTAYASVLADDARMMGTPAQPATNMAERDAELGRRAAAMEFSALGGDASEAGDLVFTYGDASWSKDGTARRGHYVRIWQKRSDGWKIVFDEIVAVPPPKA